MRGSIHQRVRLAVIRLTTERIAVSTNPLASLFGRNPFTSLQEHMRVVIRGADLVPALFEALVAEKQEEVDRIKEEIFAIEEEADVLRMELRKHLPGACFYL